MASYRPTIQGGLAPQAPAAPRLNPNAYGGFGEALQGLAGVAQQEIERRQEQHDIATLGRLRADATVRTQTFLQELSRSPDYGSYNRRWTEFRAGLEQELLNSSGVSERVAQAFQGEWLDLATRATINVRDMAYDREDNHNLAQLNYNLHTLANVAGFARTDEEFTIAQDQIRLSVGEAIVSGAIDEAQASELILATLGDAEMLRARQMIVADPLTMSSRLSDPNQFIALTPEQRFSLQVAADNEVERQANASVAAANRAETEAEQAARDQAMTAAREIRLRLANGEQVSYDEITSVAPLLDDGDFSNLLSAWEGREDPAALRTYTTIDQMSRSPTMPTEAFRNVLNERLEQGEITTSQYDAFMAQHEQSTGGAAVPTAFDINADAISRGLQAGPMDQLMMTERGDIERRRADALQEYYQRATPDMSPAELTAIRDDIIQRHSGGGLESLLAPPPSTSATPAAQADGTTVAADPPRPPGGAYWMRQTIVPDDIRAWTQMRLQFWIDQLGSEEAALARGSPFVLEMEQAAAWASIAEGR